MNNNQREASVFDLLGESNPRFEGLAGVRDQVSPEEWDARVELAALYRLVDYRGWTDSIYNHISLRVPGEEAFLVNPYGLLYSEITASSLAKVDIDGNVLSDPAGVGVNPAGFVIHGAIHEARPDIACVLHTHTRAGCGVAAQSQGLLPISLHAAMFHGRIGYHDFEGIVVDLDERSRLVAALGSHNALILRNHGLLTAGQNAGMAFGLMHALELACEIQLAALSAEAPDVTMISDEALAQVASVVERQDFERDWLAMRRLADRIAPDHSL